MVFQPADTMYDRKSPIRSNRHTHSQHHRCSTMLHPDDTLHHGHEKLLLGPHSKEDRKDYRALSSLFYGHREGSRSPEEDALHTLHWKRVWHVQLVLDAD